MTFCCHCEFWSEDKRRNKDRVGVCKRYPPVLDSEFARLTWNDYLGGAEAAASCWVQPVTLEFSRCGEFKEKESGDESKS